MLDAPHLRFGPRWPLPRCPRLVVGESTGSFVSRLAHSNGRTLADFLLYVGHGQASADPAKVEKYPQSTEMYVNAAGLRHLTVLTDLPAEMLRRALPSLAERHVLPGTGAAEWRWPWEPDEGYLVRRCALCGYARRRISEPVWLMSMDSWQVCLRHLRWTDDSRSADPEFISLASLPEYAQAHRDRLRLERRFGPAGEELVADAVHVTMAWWTRMPETLRWVQRAWRAGLSERAARAVPLVIYPEAVALASAMLRFEQAGQRDTAGRARWLAGVQHLMDVWDVDFSEGRDALLEWLERHSRAAPQMTASRHNTRQLTLALGHSRVAAQVGSLARRSCMPVQ